MRFIFQYRGLILILLSAREFYWPIF